MRVPADPEEKVKPDLDLAKLLFFSWMRVYRESIGSPVSERDLESSWAADGGDRRLWIKAAKAVEDALSGEAASITYPPELASTEITCALSLQRPMQILVAICAGRHIQPPDCLSILPTHRPFEIHIGISRDGYSCSTVVQDDTDNPHTPFFRAACHALIDAYESRKVREPTVSVVLESERGKK